METTAIQQEAQGMNYGYGNELAIPSLQVPVAPPIKQLPESTRELAAETKKVENQNTYDQLNQFFVEKDSKQKALLEGRNLLGPKEKELTDQQVSNLMNEVQFLVDSWLEEYERKVYGGKTLNELFNLRNI